MGLCDWLGVWYVGWWGRVRLLTINTHYPNIHMYIHVQIADTQHMKCTWASPAHGRMTGEGDCRTSSTETRRSQSAHSPLLLLLLEAGGSHAASSAGLSMVSVLVVAVLLLLGGDESVLPLLLVVIVTGSMAHGSSIVTPSLFVFLCICVCIL